MEWGQSMWEENGKRPGPNFSTITGSGQAVIEFLLVTTSQFAIKPTPVLPFRAPPARHEFDSSFKGDTRPSFIPILSVVRQRQVD